MRIYAQVALGLCLTASLAVLAISVWPGLFGDLIFVAVLFALISAIVWIPAAVIGVIALAVLLSRRQAGDDHLPLPGREIATIGVVVFATLGLLACEVPRRIAFLASRAPFESLVQSAPQSSHGVPLDQRLGIYHVDAYAADPRGGVYFRVFEGADGIGPDVMSYGFVKSPNRVGTPFGAAHYSCSHLFADWYWFMASDDWW